MVNIEKWKNYIGVIPGPFNENWSFFYNHNDLYPKCGTQHACPYGFNTYGSNQHVLFGEERKK